MWGWIVLVVFAIGCGRVEDREPIAATDSAMLDSATVDSGATLDSARSESAAADSAPVDADSGNDAADVYVPRYPLTDEQARCLGLRDSPTCVVCHRRSDVWDLLPRDTPPQPPGISPAPYEKCGVPRP